MTLREQLIVKCRELAPNFRVGIENMHRTGESIVWRGTVGEHHHAGAIQLKPGTHVADEEALLTQALEMLTEIVNREPKPEEAAAPLEETPTE